MKNKLVGRVAELTRVRTQLETKLQKVQRDVAKWVTITYKCQYATALARQREQLVKLEIKQLKQTVILESLQTGTDFYRLNKQTPPFNPAATCYLYPLPAERNSTLYSHRCIRLELLSNTLKGGIAYFYEYPVVDFKSLTKIKELPGVTNIQWRAIKKYLLGSVREYPMQQLVKLERFETKSCKKKGA